MIQFILECIAFQLVFLVIYDVALKQETFFQWNRFYLIGTYIISLVLPWAKIEALKTTVPEQYYFYPEFLWEVDNAGIVQSLEGDDSLNLPLGYAILLGGMFFATLLFCYKMVQIQQLREKGEVRYFPNFTRIIVANSHLAFSFFKTIFLGDKILEKEHESIIQHELVHISQKHSLDLLFFELMRILCWFNPLVYVYQKRISELHEFIADAQVAKTHKKEQYQLLLSQVFQTKHISFINQFFKSSLIKKRIVMLQKSRSGKLRRLRYLLLIPVVTSMLFYTSCQNEGRGTTNVSITVEDVENLTQKEENEIFTKLIDFSVGDENWTLSVEDKNSIIKFIKGEEGSYLSGPGNVKINAKMIIESSTLGEDFSFFDGKGSNLIQISVDNIAIPYAVVDEVPVFPGCEGVEDQRNCFNEKMQRHIKKHFAYPKEAKEAGIQGRVNVMFIIAEGGNIRNVKLKGPDKLLENEVERIIKRLPKMRPGKHKGVATNVYYSIPITFKL